MERMRSRDGVNGGGVFFLFWGGELNDKKITKIKYNKGLRWLPSIFCHAITNQKHAGMMEGGWDRPHNCARSLGEHDGNDKPLAEGDKDNGDGYSKDGDIPDNDNEYTIGVNDVGKPLDEGDHQRCPRTSMPCKSAAKCALTLKVSYSQWAALRV